MVSIRAVCSAVIIGVVAIGSAFAQTPFGAQSYTIENLGPDTYGFRVGTARSLIIVGDEGVMYITPEDVNGEAMIFFSRQVRTSTIFSLRRLNSSVNLASAARFSKQGPRLKTEVSLLAWRTGLHANHG